MKKIMFVALALLMGLASCVKDKQYPGITISNVTYNPTAVQENDEVTVTATITSFKEIIEAKVVYTIDGESLSLAMTKGTDNLYKAVIPAFADGTTVSFYVEADNNEVTAASPVMEYTVGAVAIDYSVLRLNELNGNDKFIEIYNAGADAINLNGVYIEKDGAQNWLADNTVKIDAGGYLLLYSEDVTIEGAAQAGYPESLTFHSGLSAKKNVRIQLFTPAGVSIDDFNLTGIDANDPAYIPAPASYSRNADGKWYYSDATPGAVNVDGTVVLLGLEGGDTPEPPAGPDYSNIVLNELNGSDKFIEIYNKGDMDLPLEGMFIMKDDYVAGATWTADATVVAPAHGYVLLYSVDVAADYSEQPENLFFNSGLSAKKTVRITLFMPDGTVRDEFTRGTTGEWGQTISTVEGSYARTPDGGDWKLAEATPGEANPATGDDIPQE